MFGPSRICLILIAWVLCLQLGQSLNIQRPRKYGLTRKSISPREPCSSNAECLQKGLPIRAPAAAHKRYRIKSRAVQTFTGYIRVYTTSDVWIGWIAKDRDVGTKAYYKIAKVLGDALPISFDADPLISNKNVTVAVTDSPNNYFSFGAADVRDMTVNDGFVLPYGTSDRAPNGPPVSLSASGTAIFGETLVWTYDGPSGFFINTWVNPNSNGNSIFSLWLDDDNNPNTIRAGLPGCCEHVREGGSGPETIDDLELVLKWSAN